LPVHIGSKEVFYAVKKAADVVLMPEAEKLFIHCLHKINDVDGIIQVSSRIERRTGHNLTKMTDNCRINFWFRLPE
jgi:hypothetical protein